jgi:hypothetical protein
MLHIKVQRTLFLEKETVKSKDTRMGDFRLGQPAIRATTTYLLCRACYLMTDWEGM